MGCLMTHQAVKCSREQGWDRKPFNEFNMCVPFEGLAPHSPAMFDPPEDTDHIENNNQ